MKNIEIDTIYSHPETGKSLGFSSDGKMYYGGKEVITKKKTTFNWWVNLSILAASLGTVVTAIFAVLEYFKE